MTPEGKSRHRKRQTSTQRLCHGNVRCVAVTSPVHRELLSSCCRTSCKNNRLLLTFYFFQQFKNTAVIKKCIVIVHADRLAAILVHNIDRDSLAKIRFKAVHTHFQQTAQLALIPFAGFRICKIHNSHAILPVIGLPDTVSVCALQQITACCSFPEGFCSLRNIRVDPYTDFQPSFMITLQHSLYIRECLRIPFKITPLQSFHPEAVKMEYAQGDLPLLHAFQKRGNCLLIIIRRKGGRKPQSKGPCRRKRWTSGQTRIGF